MSVKIISLDSTIDWVQKALSLKLKNKDLYDEIFNKFLNLTKKERVQINVSNNSIDALDLSEVNGERLIISFNPSSDNYDSIIVKHSCNIKNRDSYEISFTTDDSVSIKIERTEFIHENNLITGMKMNKSSKQYNKNQLMFAHVYESETVVSGVSSSSDTLIQANPRGFANKRVAVIKDIAEKNAFEVSYYASNEFAREVFNTMDINYIPAGFRKCNKDIYEKFYLTLKK